MGVAMASAPQKVPENFHALYDRAARAARGVTMAAAPPESYCETHTIEGATITLGVQRHG